MQLEDEVERLRTENAALHADNHELCAQVGHLQEQLAAALARISELEQQRRDPPPFVKPNTASRTGSKPARKKRDPRHNQARRRQPPSRTIDHALDRCPDCHYQLRGSSVDYTRQVLELPAPPPLEVIEHRVIKRFCPACRRWRTPRLDLRGQALGRSRIGVRLASLIGYLRTPRN